MTAPSWVFTSDLCFPLLRCRNVLPLDPAERTSFSIRDASFLLPTRVTMPRRRMRLMPDQDLFAFGNRGFPDEAEQHMKTLLESLLASKITEDEEKGAVESAIKVA